MLGPCIDLGQGLGTADPHFHFILLDLGLQLGVLRAALPSTLKQVAELLVGVHRLNHENAQLLGLQFLACQLLKTGQRRGQLGLRNGQFGLGLVHAALRQHLVGFGRQAALHTPLNELIQALVCLQTVAQGLDLLLARLPFAPGLYGAQGQLLTGFLHLGLGDRSHRFSPRHARAQAARTPQGLLQPKGHDLLVFVVGGVVFVGTDLLDRHGRRGKVLPVGAPHLGTRGLDQPGLALQQGVAFKGQRQQIDHARGVRQGAEQGPTKCGGQQSADSSPQKHGNGAHQKVLEIADTRHQNQNQRCRNSCKKFAL